MTQDKKPDSSPEDPTPVVGAETDIAPIGHLEPKPAHEQTADEDLDLADWARVAATAEFKALLAAKLKFIVPATLFFVTYYFALPIRVGYAPEWMARKVIGVVNLAYLFALSQLFMAWMLAALYLRASGRFDRMAENIIVRLSQRREGVYLDSTLAISCVVGNGQSRSSQGDVMKRFAEIVAVTWVLIVLMAGISRPGQAQALRGESPYVYGIHDFPGSLSTLDNLLNRKGWVLLMMYISSGPAGRNPLIDQLVNTGYGVVVRLHWDTGDGEGTIPVPALYPTFANNAKGTVQNNPSAKYWIIGNETNLCSEWPRGTGFPCNGTRRTTQITPADYANCYIQTHNKIHELDGTIPNLHVIPAPTGVWAGDIPSWGVTDFLCDFVHMMQLIPHNKIDAFAFHPKTHGHNPALITDTRQSPPDFGCNHNERVYWEFLVYRDLMQRIPADLRNRKVFLTELNPHSETGWSDVDNGYLVAAYEEVNRWNRGQVAGWTGQKITGMVVYRWEGGEAQWRLDRAPNVQRDLRNAVSRGYRWDTGPPAAWSPWTRTNNGNTTFESPSLAVFNRELYLLIRGDDQQVYVSKTANGTTWTAWQPVADGLTDAAPTLAIFAGVLFAFAAGIDGYVYFSYSLDGNTWADWGLVTEEYPAASQPVAALEYAGAFFLFLRGEDRHLYFITSKDGFSWTSWSEVPFYNGLTDHPPAAIVFGNKLYLVVVGINGDIFYNYYDAYSDVWLGWTPAYVGPQADKALAVAVYQSKLFLMRKNPGATTLSYAWSANGTTWMTWQSTGNGGTTNVPAALAAFGDRLYSVRKDGGNRGLYVSVHTE